MKSVYGLIGLVLATIPSSAAEVAVDSTIKIRINTPVYVTAKGLLAACNADAKTTDGQEICKDYIAGVVDTITANRNVIQGYQICWPKTALELDDYRLLYIKHMHDHPEYSGASAASVVDSMLFANYRCAGTTAPSAEEFKGTVHEPAELPPR